MKVLQDNTAESMKCNIEWNSDTWYEGHNKRKCPLSAPASSTSYQVQDLLLDQVQDLLLDELLAQEQHLLLHQHQHKLLAQEQCLIFQLEE
ncbi:hypothetical protein RDI58_000608 [Solanum bulbocastanum]|uniref:Uncharacterized protein n=1 Tax=Solanum bulbocastanum TaxID=147425 RepID=A0AAN8UAR3_SOLBU